ncbi:MAG: peptidase domain-containing ABC transporter, partial [Bacteroidota bacterium]
MPISFPFYKQLDAMDCGVASLRMVARFHGRHYNPEFLRSISYPDREGVSLMDISDAAEHIGMHTLAVKIPYDVLPEEIPVPFVAHWRQNHFIVVYKVKKDKVWVADPAHGKVTLTREQFIDGWGSDTVNGERVGVILMMEPTPRFYEREGEKENKISFGYLFQYFNNYTGLLWQLVIGLLVGSFLQVAFPFLMQSVVDTGIENQDLNFIYIVLIAQLVLYISQTAVEYLRSWILLYIGARVNISMISDFLLKMMRLPIRFFDTKMIGDLLQRIQDNRRVEVFLTSSALFTAFSFVTFFIFAIILALYDGLIISIFMGATVAYIVWVLFFLKKRKELDYRRFDQMADNQSNLIQLINGMQEIKLHNAEKQKRWKWERIQAKLFRISVSYLRLEQLQSAGGKFINELKNILITFIAARAVIAGTMTLGEMMAVQYIIGQLNGPISQWISFIKSYQDAGISLERLNEIHSKEEEETVEGKMNILPANRDLTIENVFFQYGGPNSSMILKNINLTIPQGKKIAIVGTSGSGKTTLLKLLLNFYPPTKGTVKLGETTLSNVRNKLWREKCGVVMQGGYIFSDTIANNIALGDEIVDKKKLLHAVKVANAQTFIEGLPLGYNTKIGSDGIGLSQGQKQRLLLARAVYKNPEFIFLDEATNALDAY